MKKNKTKYAELRCITKTKNKKTKTKTTNINNNKNAEVINSQTADHEKSTFLFKGAMA